MLKPFLKLAAIVLSIVAFLPAIWLARALGKKKLYENLICKAYRMVLLSAGLKLTVSGAMSTARPLMLVSNHVSYIDILLLGAAAPMRFTPKSDIKKWPVIGSICRLVGCVFIDRSVTALEQEKAEVAKALATGDVVSVFPEATTGNGLHMLPFRPAFFSIAGDGVEGRPLAIQPLAIEYTDIWKLPIDTEQWTQIAWYGDMELLPHAWNMLKMGGIGARLTFLPVIEPSQHDRKELAEISQRAISDQLERGRRSLSEPQQTASSGRMFAWLRSKP